MTLLTSYPLLREDFEKWLEEKAPRLKERNFYNGRYEIMGLFVDAIAAQPIEIQHFYLSLYAESVGYKIREIYNGIWYWNLSIADEPFHSAWDTFPAAFEHFAQIRENELNNK